MICRIKEIGPFLILLNSMEMVNLILWYSCNYSIMLREILCLGKRYSKWSGSTKVKMSSRLQDLRVRSLLIFRSSTLWFLTQASSTNSSSKFLGCTFLTRSVYKSKKCNWTNQNACTSLYPQKQSPVSFVLRSSKKNGCTNFSPKPRCQDPWETHSRKSQD